LVGVLTRALGVRYGAATALADVSLAAAPGEVLGVVGPNGSGKSSLVKALAGLVPHAGDVFFDGARARPARLGYMPQDTGARAALTVLETVLLGRCRQLGLGVSRLDLELAGAALDELGISTLAGRYLDELSGGQRQLAFLAQALVGAPPVLLLDEPTSALDIRNQLEVLALLRRLTRARTITTVCVLHDLNAAARHADRIALMDGGRLAALGAPAAVLTAGRIADVFGVEADVTTGADGAVSLVPVRAIAQTPPESKGEYNGRIPH
jgi:iron complex transport system ATP-binding protein